MAQWGGACEFLLSTHANVPIAKDGDPDTLKVACLYEMSRLKPRAWNALVERHWRIEDIGNWVPEFLPTETQLRRALDAEHRLFGFETARLLKSAAVIAGIGGAIAVGRPVAVFVAIWCAGVWRRSRPAQSQRRGAGDRTQAHERREDAGQAHFEAANWRTVDPAFSAWFSRHFNPDTGLYKTAAMRVRICDVFMRVVESKGLQDFERLARHLRATFHPDSSQRGQFTLHELTDISQYVSQHLPLRKAA